MDKDFLLQSSLGIDVIKNFDYVNFFIFLREQPYATFTANISGVLPEHPKLDHNPTFTSLSKTTRTPAPFIWEFPP